jgi:penicillin amidase
MDSPAPLIFNAWMGSFYRAVLARAGVPVASGGPIADFLPAVLSAEGAHWCGGACAGMLRESLEGAVRELTGRFGEDPAAWRWGAAHQAVFAHPILRSVPLLGWWTTISIGTPGDDNTLWRGGMNAALQSVHGASFRGVYDLADLDRSVFMIAPGQSGNPFSSHARDFVVRWRDGATITLGPEAATLSGTVKLTP